MDPVITSSLVYVAVLYLFSSSVLGFTAVYSQDALPQGRKFGGYRIVPKSCKDLTSNGKNKGICMFNYECTQRNGQVVGSCMDGFLFGACCKLPPGIVYQGIEFPSTTPSTVSYKPTSPQSDPLKPLTFHPIGETILLHKNGSVVKDQNSPQEFDLIKNTQYGTTPPELSTFSYVSGPGGLVSSNGINPVTKPDKIDQWTTKSSQKSTTWGVPTADNSEHLSDKDTVTPFLLVSTREEPALYSSTTAKYSAYSKPFTTDKNYYTTINKSPETYNVNHISSSVTHKISSSTDYAVTKPAYYTSIKVSLKPRPTQTLVTKRPAIVTNHNDDDNNMILIPTLNVDDYNKHDSEDGANNESINHILNILNETGPSPEPIATSSPNFSTWVSINNRPEKTNSPVYTTSTHFYHYTNTKPPSLPSTTLYQVYGPSFQVTPQASVTPKPQINTTPEQAPTVIVLGPLNPVSQSKPNRKPVNTYSSSTVKPLNTVTVISPPEHSTVIHDSGTISVGTTATQSTYWTTISPNYNSNPQVTVTHPSTSGIYYATKPQTTTIKPVQGHIHPSNKPSQLYSNKPRPTPPPKIDTYSQLPVSSTTQIPIVYLTAKPVTAKPVTYNKPSQGLYTTAKPQKPSVNKVPYTTVRPTTIKIPTYEQIQNSTEYLIAFPPVRDPNITIFVSQQEKPDHLTPEIYNEDDTQSTPQFVVDENLDNKVHGFVEKIVQSLGGNFVDLENVLLDGQTKVNTSQTQYPTKRPTSSSTPTRKPIKKPVKRPTNSSSSVNPTAYKPTVYASTNRPSPTVLLVSTYRPKPEEVVSITSTYKPTKWPSPTPSLVLFQPSSTKRPKTTKKPTVTTVVIDNFSVSEESTEATSPTTSTTPTKFSEVNFKKECGVRPLMKNGRIVGGKGATFGEWPWQVLVREATWLGLFTKNKCGGVLITNRYVITAAHCQPGFLASLVAVFGEYDISGELESKRSISKNIRRVIVHRQYDAATFENDIALLELDTPVAFDSHIVPICMPGDEEDFTGRMATVTGWGRLKYGGGVPSVLQEVQVPVIENQVCQEMFQTAGHSKTIISSFLCAGYANGQRDSCEGDSGGPLMVEREDGKWELAGTVSHGIKCAAPYLPGVYMRTTYYKPWLQTITGVRNL